MGRNDHGAAAGFRPLVGRRARRRLVAEPLYSCRWGGATGRGARAARGWGWGALGRLGILQPPDLRGRSVSLVVARRDAEDDGRLRGVVDVGRLQRLVRHGALVVRSAVHAHKRQLGRRRRTALVLGVLRLDRQVNGVLQDVAGGRRGRFPREVRSFGRFRDFDGGRGAGEAGQTGLERGHVAPLAPAAAVDGGDAEPVRAAWFQVQALELGYVGEVVGGEGLAVVQAVPLVKV